MILSTTHRRCSIAAVIPFLLAIHAIVGLVSGFGQEVSDFGSDAESFTGKAKIKTLTSRDYKGNPNNFFLLEDPQGFIYSLNPDGVFRFTSSGSRKIASGSYTYGAFDEEGNLWVGGYRAFGKLSQDETGVWEFENLYDAIADFDSDGFLPNSILFKDGVVYLSNRKCALRYEPGADKAELIFSSPYIRRMYSIGNKIIPVASDSSIYFWNGAEMEEVPNSGFFYGENGPISSAQLSNGNIVILTSGGNFWIYDGEKIYAGDYTRYTGNPRFEVSSVSGTSEGSLLIGTKGNGVWIVTESTCRVVRREQGLVTNYINSIHESNDGTVWISHDKGISVMSFPENSWFFGKDEGIQGNVQDISILGDEAYILTSVHNYRVNVKALLENNNSNLRFEKLPFAASKTSVVFDDQILIGTNVGLMIGEGDQWVHVGEGDCSLVFRSRVHPNHIYFGGFEGLYSLEMGANGKWGIPNKILDRENVVHGIGESKDGTIWLRMGMAKVGRLIPPDEGASAWTFQELGSESGVPAHWINPLIVEGKCYILGENLLVYDDLKEAFVSQTDWYYFGGGPPFNFTQEVWSQSGGSQVAYSELIANLVPKPQGGIYEALEFFGEALDNRALCFREQDGLRILGFYGGVIFQRTDVRTSSEPKAFDVFVGEITDTKAQKPISAFFGNRKDQTQPVISVDSEVRDIRFSFTTNRFFLQEKNLYNFYLKGYEQPNDNWVSDISKDYTNLRPGKYTFIIKGRDFLNQVAGPLEVSILIHTPWYMTNIAYGFYFLALIFVILLSINVRERHLRVRNNWLTKVVEERTEEIRLQANELIAKNDRLEEALKSAKQLTEESKAASIAKGRFLASMSHEIRTPMNGVIGMCSMLEDTELDDLQLSFLGTIRDSGEHLLTILNDILDYSKIEAGKLELQNHSFSVRKVAEGVVSLLAPLAKEKGIELTLYVDPEIRRNRMGDPSRLRQIFFNLLGNAIKFTEQGYIRVRMIPFESDEQKDWLRIEFEDSGIGIPFEKQDHLFEAFSQVDDTSLRKFGGTGLGLSISKNLTERMGGDVFVFSLPGKGTIFGIEVPLAEDMDFSPELAPCSFEGKVIWVVSRDDGQIRVLESYLSDCEAEVISLNGDEILDQNLEELKHTPDLLILDLIDGLATDKLMRKLKNSFPELVVIFLRDELSETSGDSKQVFLIKPYAFDELIQICQKALCLEGKTDSHEHRRRGRSELYAGKTEEFDGLKVLLVEDNRVNQKVAVLMLRKYGIDPDIAGDGKQAIEAVMKCDYDVILMDIQMPVMDGVEATRWIRGNLDESKQPKIVAMTAGVTALDRDLTIEVGMDGFIEKPVRPSQLYDEIAKVVRY